MIDDVYAAAVRDLAGAAHGAGALDSPHVTVMVDNPMCGDRVTLDLTISDDRVAALAHRVRGCMLCEASASAIGLRASGSAPSDLRTLARAMEMMIRRNGPAPTVWPELEAFSPVQAMKSRHTCVLLPFMALVEALDKAGA